MCGLFLAMIEVMPIVDHVLVWLFGNDVIFPESPLYSYVRVFGCVRENIIAGEILFHAVLRHYVPHNMDAIIGTLWLNIFDIVGLLCCMYLIDRFSQFLRCEVALHFECSRYQRFLTFNYQKQLQLLF